MALDNRLLEVQQEIALKGKHPYAVDDTTIFVPEEGTDYGYAYVIAERDKDKLDPWEEEGVYKVLMVKDATGEYKAAAPGDLETPFYRMNLGQFINIGPDHPENFKHKDIYQDDAYIHGINLGLSAFEPIQINAADINKKISEVQYEAIKNVAVQTDTKNNAIEAIIKEYKTGNSKFPDFGSKYAQEISTAQGKADSEKILQDADYIFADKLQYPNFEKLNAVTKTYVFARALQEGLIDEASLQAAEKFRNKGITTPTVDDYRETIYPRFLGPSVYSVGNNQPANINPLLPQPAGQANTQPNAENNGTTPEADDSNFLEKGLGFVKNLTAGELFMYGLAAMFGPGAIAKLPGGSMIEKLAGPFGDKIGFVMIGLGIASMITGSQNLSDLGTKSLDIMKGLVPTSLPTTGQQPAVGTP